MPDLPEPSDVAVRHLLPQPWDGSLVYQRYYLMGLEQVAKLRIRPLPLLARLVPGVDRKVSALLRMQSSGHPSHCGRYEADIGGRKIRFAIDGTDSSPIHHPDILEWSDLYFKANQWPTIHYDRKVTPIVNGSGNLNWNNIRWLQSLRNFPKDLDAVFVANLWGGREHNVKLFEELSKLKCRKELLAIFPAGGDEEETRALFDRLKRHGVPFTLHPLPTKRFWETMARARVVFRRAGNHLCIPWGMVDLLCMGACMVLDADPYPQWPCPLKPGIHFSSCGIHRPLDGSPAADADYLNIVPAIGNLLDSPARMQDIREAGIHYFEKHASPERVARYILDVLGAATWTRI